MVSLGIKFDNLYRKIGDRGLLFLIFTAGIFLHTIFSLGMNIPSIYPDELAAMTWSAFFSGFDQSGAASNYDAASGWLASALYAPFYFLISEPENRYKGMLILNSLIIALIPVFTYKITASLGLKKAWQRTLCAIAAGFGAAAFAYSKFIWSETLCVFLPFLLALLFIRSSEVKNRFLRFILSVFAAFVCAFAPAAHPRLWLLVLVFILTVIFATFILRVKSILFASFIPLFVILAAFQVYVGEYLTAITRGQPVSSPDFYINFGGLGNFFTVLTGQLYYLAVSTWALGTLGVCLCVSALWEYRENRRRKAPYPDSRMRRFGNADSSFTAFAFFVLVYNFFMLISSAAWGSALDLTLYQDSFIFGRYIDGAAPLLLVFTLCYIFIKGLDFKKLLYSTIMLGGIFALFFTFTAPKLVTVKQLRPESIQGLSPVRLGSAIDAPIDLDGLFFTVSAMFCFVALLIVFICCANRYRAHIISVCVCLTVLYSCIHSAVIYLPFEARHAQIQNRGAYAISEYIYNSSDAPPAYVLDSLTEAQGENPSLAPILRFLNRYAYIGNVENYGSLPEDCFIIVKSELTAQFGDDVTILAETEGLVFAAKGEKAAAFALSQEIY